LFSALTLRETDGGAIRLTSQAASLNAFFTVSTRHASRRFSANDSIRRLSPHDGNNQHFKENGVFVLRPEVVAFLASVLICIFSKISEKN
jgi:hypothetical protein